MIKKWFNKLFLEETNNTFIQFFRSLFVGGIATVADIGVLILFREFFHMPEKGATVFGFIAGLTVNYVVSTFWVFAKAKVKNRVVDFIAFAVIGIIGSSTTGSGNTMTQSTNQMMLESPRFSLNSYWMRSKPLCWKRPEQKKNRSERTRRTRPSGGSLYWII